MMSLRRTFAIALAALSWSLFGLLPAHAQLGLPDDAIESIAVEGNQRIERSTIESYLTVQPGDPFDPRAIEQSLTSLFRTGLFADVQFERQGQVLIINVVENPIINRISFEGNDRIDDEQLLAEIQLRPRVVYTRTRVQSDVTRVQEVYRRSGRFAATVTPEVIQLDQNRVDLVFSIDEGPLTTIRSISFVGNEVFSDSELEGQILSEESGLLDFLSSTDTYDPDRLAVDREMLRDFYLSEGYADFRVVSAVAELTPTQDEFFITFTVEEGPRYTFGNIDIQSEIPDVDTASLMPLVVGESGDYFSNNDIDQTIDVLGETLADRQYAFAEVTPRIQVDRENTLVNVIYDIDEGARVFVERIEISGNVRTVDSVIRREFELVEGDPFSASRMRASQERIEALGFFADVTVDNVPGSTPDQTVIQVNVEEQSTGELLLGGGYSSYQGPIGQISLEERNLLGRGQRLRIAATIGGRTQEFDLRFTEPRVFDRPISAGFEAFRITTDNQDESSYDEFRFGFSVNSGYRLAPHLFHSVEYRLQQVEITDVGASASRLIALQEGQQVTSLVGHELTYDMRDSRIRPTEGYILTLGNDFAGIGGDTRFIRTTASGSIFFPIYERDYVLNLRGEMGYIVGLGDDVRITDRFFVGGPNLRGFEVGGIGPRDLATNDAMGGNSFAVGTVELAFPLGGFAEDLGFRGRTFTDFGVLTGTDDADFIDNGSGGNAINLVDEASVRVSIGAGLSWDSPLGPVNLDIAYPVLSESFDQDQLFSFSFGTTF